MICEGKRRKILKLKPLFYTKESENIKTLYILKIEKQDK